MAATAQTPKNLTDLAKEHDVDVALIELMMKSLGGTLETKPTILLAVPEAMVVDKLKTAKRPDSEEVLTPIEVGMLMHFLTQIRGAEPTNRPAPSVQPTNTELGPPKTKVSDVVDQMDEHQFIAPTEEERAKYRNNYKMVTGGLPAPKHTPTGHQLGGLASKLERGASPYVDFAIFNPHGARMAKIRKFTAQVWVRGQLETKHLTGPGSFEEWLDCWTLFRVTMICLLEASPQMLDDYANGIKELVTLFPSSWGLIWAADETMRSEQWGYMKEQLVDAKSWPETRPWDEVLARTTFGKGDVTTQHFWNLHVVIPATQTGGGVRVVQELEGTKHLPSTDGLFMGMNSSSSQPAGSSTTDRQKVSSGTRRAGRRRPPAASAAPQGTGGYYAKGGLPPQGVVYGKGKNQSKGKGKGNKGKDKGAKGAKNNEGH